jgi:hypothetical protein
VAAQGIAQITGNGAHVTAFAAGHFKLHVICIRAICQQQFDPKRRAAISNFSPSRRVRPFTIDFDGRKERRCSA